MITLRNFCRFILIAFSQNPFLDNFLCFSRTELHNLIRPNFSCNATKFEIDFTSFPIGYEATKTTTNLLLNSLSCCQVCRNCFPKFPEVANRQMQHNQFRKKFISDISTYHLSSCRVVAYLVLST